MQTYHVYRNGTLAKHTVAPARTQIWPGEPLEAGEQDLHAGQSPLLPEEPEQQQSWPARGPRPI